MRTARRRAGVALRVQLLGRIELATDRGSPIRLTGRHAQALFALLVLSRRPRSRDALATEGASASSYLLTDADTVWSAIRSFFTEQSAKPGV